MKVKRVKRDKSIVTKVVRNKKRKEKISPCYDAHDITPPLGTDVPSVRFIVRVVVREVLLCRTGPGVIFPVRAVWELTCVTSPAAMELRGGAVP